MFETGIFKCSVPTLPQFRFEWHPASKKLYKIDVGKKPEIAQVIADAEIVNEGQARMCILYFCRGYQEAKREMTQGYEGIEVAHA